MPTQPSILLIAPEGMLGTAWSRLLEQRGIPYRTAALPGFDITDAASIRRHVTAELGVVVNCSAYTDVDGAEEHEERATAINGSGVGELAVACKDTDALLVHYSTDYVFNGNATQPYRTDQALDPLNAYGRSKAVGEQAIRDTAGPHLILRTSWLYAPWANNFVRTIARLATERESLKVVDDQRGRPTSAEHLAAASLRLIEEDAHGTLHLTDGGQCTWFDFATAIAARANPECKIEPCGSDAYPRPAKRPAYSVLDLGPTEAIIGEMPNWQHNLAAVMDQMAVASSK
ncbi:MAG: dTDP-4-dehydrorhamnose reductase [Planctomycetota bacterium]